MDLPSKRFVDVGFLPNYVNLYVSLSIYMDVCSNFVSTLEYLLWVGDDFVLCSSLFC